MRKNRTGIGASPASTSLNDVSRLGPVCQEVWILKTREGGLACQSDIVLPSADRFEERLIP